MTTATEILDARLAEIARRDECKKAAKLAFLEAYPDVRAWLQDLRSEGFEVKFSRFDFAVHGPLRKECPEYPATMRAHTSAPSPSTRKRR